MNASYYAMTKIQNFNFHIPPGDNPKDSRNTGVQLRKCHKDKICCPKIWSRKGCQYQKSTMPCPKSKFSIFIRFLPRYRPKGFQYLQGPKIWQKKKKIPPGDNPKDSINTGVQFNLGNVIRTRYAAPKFVTDKQTFSDPSSSEVENIKPKIDHTNR